MKTLNESDDDLVEDTDRLAVNLFKEEGAFLHQAAIASDALTRRLAALHPNVASCAVSRDELAGWAYQLKRAIAIAAEYHLAEADSPT